MCLFFNLQELKNSEKIAFTMVEFNAVIQKFEKKGEKSGWTYIDVPAPIAEELLPKTRKSFRVKGFLDQFPIAGIALVPMGEGDFILALNAEIRKGICKREGAPLLVRIEVDHDYQVPIPSELLECLDNDPDSLDFFNSLNKSHRDYFIRWINSAKTTPTREKRIVQMLTALSKKQGYSEMIRSLKNNR